MRKLEEVDETILAKIEGAWRSNMANMQDGMRAIGTLHERMQDQNIK